ncbi:hypothetical protein H6P81_016444 [Aristolochia fimbriata]|uniref:Uncharacterized protein n=1 Tax=Aristolochia fimbriata TaxID=158543 RepID=A0AAV7EA04_ARIFI|nr:hypothetical protein H6P81_016444 [Aristolochia fimbriata]
MESNLARRSRTWHFRRIHPFLARSPGALSVARPMGRWCDGVELGAAESNLAWRSRTWHGEVELGATESNLVFWTNPSFIGKDCRCPYCSRPIGRWYAMGQWCDGVGLGAMDRIHLLSGRWCMSSSWPQDGGSAAYLPVSPSMHDLWSRPVVSDDQLCVLPGVDEQLTPPSDTAKGVVLLSPLHDPVEYVIPKLAVNTPSHDRWNFLAHPALRALPSLPLFFEGGGSHARSLSGEGDPDWHF